MSKKQRHRVQYVTRWERAATWRPCPDHRPVPGERGVLFCWTCGNDARGVPATWEPCGEGETYAAQAADLGVPVRAEVTATLVDDAGKTLAQVFADDAPAVSPRRARSAR